MSSIATKIQKITYSDLFSYPICPGSDRLSSGRTPAGTAWAGIPGRDIVPGIFLDLSSALPGGRRSAGLPVPVAEKEIRSETRPDILQNLFCRLSAGCRLPGRLS